MATHKEVLAKIKQVWSHGIPASGTRLVEPAYAEVRPRVVGVMSKVWGSPRCHMCGEELPGNFLLVKTVRGKSAKMCVNLVECGSRYVKNQAKIVSKVQSDLDEGVRGVTI